MDPGPVTYEETYFSPVSCNFMKFARQQECNGGEDKYLSKVSRINVPGDTGSFSNSRLSFPIVRHAFPDPHLKYPTSLPSVLHGLFGLVGGKLISS